jgi:phosphotriesterase-related protein
VLGELPYEQLGITDAHNHAWIGQVAGADPSAPVLDDFDRIREELCRFQAAGGSGLLDCQPAFCGRDARQLARLSQQSGVHIVACTGFHRARYYPPEAPIFSMSAGQCASLFLRELSISVAETEDAPEPIRAGFIKIALEERWANTPQAALEGAAEAARQSGALVEIHTEKGALAEKAVLFFEAHGVAPGRLVLCHMDKRPNLSLHKELARYGVALEYDTFYRPKYRPEENLWPLIAGMVAEGLSAHVTLATDMAEAAMYQSIGNGPGLASLPGEIRSRLQAMGIDETSIRRMLGENIARRLAGFNQ